ncbi:MAG: ATP synthase F1 subunit gamma [Bacteroidales bacterium]|jgi:F-type H+-transporting ATPase subunit gamma|nr:ATP synthase F1 subunit gamma [Bacteroidales bacterium]MDD4544911.1 ATP synthase F1 subunit gamma [Bacteroidales bacterium]MDY0054407.1 ATP synthase F1 subunit gamma [Bacteroidales bacterium]
MANLKEVRNRISSVGSIMQITSAMKMVSASKLRRAQNTIISLRPYSALFTEVIGKIMASDNDLSNSEYGKREKEEKILLLVLTSNKGLCGGFSSNIIKATKRRIDEIRLKERNAKIEIYSFGKKSSEFFNKQKEISLYGTNDEIWDNFSFENVSAIGNKLMQEYKNKRFDRVEIIYNQFKNSATQILTNEIFLPVQVKSKENNKSNDDKIIFEPSFDEVKNNIIPQSLRNQIYKCFLDSFASEHGARMTAMHLATDNAQNLLKDLKLSYNKARQAAITNEIIEISSGAEALNE